MDSTNAVVCCKCNKKSISFVQWTNKKGKLEYTCVNCFLLIVNNDIKIDTTEKGDN